MNNNIKPLPNFLVKRHKDWNKKLNNKSKKEYLRLANEGQKPKFMLISCCDSRINPYSIFGSDIGEFFIHRNIANLVPPFNTKNKFQETSASIEFAVKSLKIKNIIILGHSNCGGIKNLIKSFSNKKKSNNNLFVNNWLKIINISRLTRFNKINTNKKQELFEKESIKNSLLNLCDYPFIKNLTKKEKINIHGLWFNIASRKLSYLNSKSKKFEIID